MGVLFLHCIACIPCHTMRSYRAQIRDLRRLGSSADLRSTLMQDEPEWASLLANLVLAANPVFEGVEALNARFACLEEEERLHLVNLSLLLKEQDRSTVCFSQTKSYPLAPSAPLCSISSHIMHAMPILSACSVCLAGGVRQEPAKMHCLAVYHFRQRV